jgi:hypothetical protein
MHRLAARVAEHGEFCTGHDSTDKFGEFRFEAVRGAEADSAIELPFHGVDDRGWGVAEEHRTECKRVVDVFVSVDVDKPRPAAGLEADRNRPLTSPESRRYAASQR